MSKRLVIVARELNVGTGTIVEFLNGKGFDIDNKPIAEVTPAMEEVLQKEYSKSASIKKDADNIVIGTRPIALPPPPRPVLPPPPKPVVKPPVVASPPPAAAAVPPAPAVAPAAAPAAVSAPVAAAVAAETKPAAPAPLAAPSAAPSLPDREGPTSGPGRPVPGLKVLGKIDLDANKRPSKPSGGNERRNNNNNSRGDNKDSRNPQRGAGSRPAPAMAKAPSSPPAPHHQRCPLFQKPLRCPKHQPNLNS
ncbi:MAG: hypothetical protein HC821_03945 [Lewinella sp.]|nr:hypothetical protein [Lewinella sp.]